MTHLEEGETYVHERTFTEADVADFADVTGDTQDIHTEPDEDGRLVVHGLLTGSLMTKIGGDLEVLASEMVFHFRKPVYTGDRIRCTWTNDRVVDHPEGQQLEATAVYERLDDDGTPEETVLEASAEGIVFE
ncbi:MAG: acyl dehydratase [Haloarculaceae archaeon]|jgi:acyl dehydratase